MRSAQPARTVALALAAVVVQFLLVTVYMWSSARLAPRDLPIAVAGPRPAVTAVARQLTRADPGAFRIISASPAGARRDITSRLVYGAIIVGGRTPQLLTASAASPVVAQLLTQVVDEMAGVSSPVRDIAPIDSNDPRGAAFGAMLLPLVVTSIMAGALLTLMISAVPWRLAGLAVFTIGGGAALAAAAKIWLGIFPGGYLTLAGVIGLIALAVAATVTGLGSLAGRRGRAVVGIALGAVITFALGNPFAGATSAPELLPRPWGAIGQWLPPGAGATLLRAVEYFNGARDGEPWAVLGAWAGGGIALIMFSGALARHATSERVIAAAEPSQQT
ncbi:MAG: hypothetical protein ABSA02_36985 [Trebonia sp.]